MDELLNQLIQTLRGMWHRRMPGLIIAWIAAIAGVVVLVRMPEKYEASARVYVDTDSLLRPLMSGLAIEPNTGQRVSILSKTLISRPNVEKLVRMTDLDHQVGSAVEKDRLVDELMSTVTLSSAGMANLYSISFRDSNPTKAKNVVDSLLSIFMESSLGDKQKDSDQARQFIEEQIRLNEQKLKDAENRLQEFRLKNLGILSGDKDYFAKMEAQSAELNRARMDLRESEQSRDSLKHELAEQQTISQPKGKNPAAPPPQIAVPELDGRIDALKHDLDDLLRKYTDQHPDVVQTKRIIDQLEEQRRREVEARLKAMQAAGPEGEGNAYANPVVQQLKIGLSEADANVAALRARVKEYESRYQQLKASAEQVPKIDTELSQLNRDYGIIKSQYDSLVARREQASMTGQMEEQGRMANFRVIDPPRVSPKPVAPNRLLFIPMVFLAALGAGLGASFVVSQILLPTFHDARGLREVTKRPVLGSISLLETPSLAKARRRGHYFFFGGLGGLAACYGAVATLLLLLRAG